MDARNDSFFGQVAKELDWRKPRLTLVIDKNLTVYVPARVLARYDREAGVEGFWDPKQGAFVFVFVKKPEADVWGKDFPEGTMRSLPGKEFFSEQATEIDLGKLPARFGFVIDSTEILEEYHGRGDEAIITSVRWRRD